jgi:alkylation response protein AidB-like acyl-CoA dehydrogenase
VLREAAELGMAAIYCSEDVGGSGLRRLDAVRIFEQMATACPTIAAFLSIHNMCTWMVDSYGTPEQRKSLVPRLASMELIASYCLTEPGAVPTRRVAHQAVRCSDSAGDHYRLDGVSSSSPRRGVRRTSSWPALVATDRGASPRSSSRRTRRESVSALTRSRWAGTRSHRTGGVDGALVPVDAMSAAPRVRAPAIAMNGLNGGRVNIAACSLGGAQAAYDKSLVYRRPAGVRHGAAGRAHHPLHARRHGHHTADEICCGVPLPHSIQPSDKVELCAMAKRYVIDACYDVADQALQLHGGYGYLREYGSRSSAIWCTGSSRNQRNHARGDHGRRAEPALASALGRASRNTRGALQ